MKNLSPKVRALLGGLLGLIVIAIVAMSLSTPQDFTGSVTRKCTSQISDTGETILTCEEA